MAEDRAVTQLADLLADLGRRVAALETAPRASYTVVRGGTTAWRPGLTGAGGVTISTDVQDDDAAMYLLTGDEVVRGYIGTIEGGTVATWRFDNPDKSDTVLELSSSTGMNGPYGLGAWVKNPLQSIDSVGCTTTTSGSAQVGWRTLVHASTAQLVVEYFADPGAATAIEVTVQAQAVLRARPGYTAAAATVVATRSVTAANTYVDVIALPTSLWSPASSPIGSLLRLDLRGRVSSGAGAVRWAPVVPAVMT